MRRNDGQQIVILSDGWREENGEPGYWTKDWAKGVAEWLGITADEHLERLGHAMQGAVDLAIRVGRGQAGLRCKKGSLGPDTQNS